MAVQIEQLLNAGAHFGHLSRRWNPRMRKYIFMKRNGIHIIDLKKTQALLEDAKNAAERISAEGKRIMFVGTKKQARDVIRDEALRAGTNYVAERWLGGMLTNFATIRKSLKRLDQIEKMESDGTAENLTKKERLMLSREKDRLLRVLGGIVDMARLPGALFIVDVRKERLAVKEAQTLGIPIFAIVDTNVDPTPIDYPIPANDDSLKTIALITKEITDAIIMGKEASMAKIADAAAADESQKDIEGGEMDEDGVKTRRRTRSRRTGGDGSEAAPGDEAAEAAAVAAETAPTVVSANESDSATMDTTIGVTGGEENDPGTGGKDAEKGEE
jgi:small subunit ribosomal protein S2